MNNTHVKYLCLLITLLQRSSVVDSLLQYPIIHNFSSSTQKIIRSNKNQILKSQEDPFDNDDIYDSPNDDAIKEDGLADWREFRSKLMATTSGESRPKSVSTKNEALLKEQNEALANEYASGVWAHTIAEVSIYIHAWKKLCAYF